MPFRGWLPGFYAISRPELTVPYPPLQLETHMLLGAFLDSRPPTREDQWRCEAEVRYIASAAIAAHLPWDSPPELVELASVDSDGNSIAARDYEKAVSAAISAHNPPS